MEVPPPLTQGVRRDNDPVAWPFDNREEPQETERDRNVHREPTDLEEGPRLQLEVSMASARSHTRGQKRTLGTGY